MEIIKDEKSFLQLVGYLKTLGKQVSRFGFAGNLHEGHFHILKKIREESEILVADLVGYLGLTWSGAPKYDEVFVEKQLIDGPVKVDFFVVNNFPYKIEERKRYLEENFLGKFISYGEQTGLSKDLCLQALQMEVTSLLDYASTTYHGPKNAIPIFVAEKLFEKKLSWNWKIVWSIFRGENEGLVSRTRGSLVLQKIVMESVEKIKNNIKNFSAFDELTNKYFLFEGIKATILDLNNMEKLDTITDNCVLVFMSGTKFDLVFIKEGEMIV